MWANLKDLCPDVQKRNKKTAVSDDGGAPFLLVNPETVIARVSKTHATGVDTHI